jgi:30S ribosomal protein S31
MHFKGKMRKCLAFFISLKKLKQINMGRGDIKTKKGKTFAGSFGKVRPAKVATKVVAPAAAEKKAAAKK